MISESGNSMDDFFFLSGVYGTWILLLFDFLQLYGHLISIVVYGSVFCCSAFALFLID